MPSALPEYRGYCLRCAAEHVFTNDPGLALKAIRDLFDRIERDAALRPFHAALQNSRGKMLGVLVAESPDGERETLLAYSGEVAGRRDWPGWVGPVLQRRDTEELEALTLARIAALDAQIAACDVEGAQRHLDDARASARAASALRRQQYRTQRSAADRAHSREGRIAGRAAEVAHVEAARQALLEVRARLAALRVARRDASRVLSTALFDAASVTNARGEKWPLREIFVGSAIAGGTTDCTVPKLLEAAHVARLRPVALAEAWWGPTIGGRHHGDLQAPCDRKCKPILGYLLCGQDS